MYEKTSEQGFVRDSKSGVILNTRIGEFEAIKTRRRAQKKQVDLEERVRVLENEVRNLKELLCLR